jgi:DNA-binding beta-propeller fold protein YncE
VKRLAALTFLLVAAIPAATALAKPGDLIVAERGDSQIVRINPANGNTTEISSGPPLALPVHLAFEPSGNIAVSDELGGSGVYRVNPGTGDATQLTPDNEFANAFGIARAADGSFAVVDYNADTLRRVHHETGEVSDIAVNGFIDHLSGVVARPNGSFFATDLGYPAVIEVDPDGDQSLLASGDPFVEPSGIAAAPKGTLFVGDLATGELYRVNSRTGGVSLVTDETSSPYGVAVAPNGKVYVTDAGNGTISAVDPKSGDVTPVADGLDGPTGIIIEPPRCKGRFATIVGSKKKDKLKGSRFADVIAGLKGNDKIKGLQGKDRICGGRGKDKLKGGPGKDKLKGGPGVDKLKGGPGKDQEIQ